MASQQQSDCLQTMLDILCYEVLSQRLSPEMERLLGDHLKECPCCRRGVHQFEEVVRKADFQRNFG